MQDKRQSPSRDRRCDPPTMYEIARQDEGLPRNEPVRGLLSFQALLAGDYVPDLGPGVGVDRCRGSGIEQRRLHFSHSLDPERTLTLR
jgi:hypothetical protein